MTKQKLTNRMYLYFSDTDCDLADRLKPILGVESVNAVVRAALAKLAQENGLSLDPTVEEAR